jgi:hypothetical protein
LHSGLPKFGAVSRHRLNCFIFDRLNKIDKCPNFGTIAFSQFWSDAGPDRNHAQMSLLRSA